MTHTGLIVRIGQALQRRAWSLVVAESCTGGTIAGSLTEIAGCSAWFDRGFVVYSDAAKYELLDVSTATLQRYGAVSRETVVAMARGSLRHSAAQIGLAVSGVAGPGGGSVDKPVGTVWLALATTADDVVFTDRQCFCGDRSAVRRQTTQHALACLADTIDGLG